MMNRPPYPPATIPPSEYYKPTPMSTYQPLAPTGTYVDHLVVAAVILAVLVGVALVIFRSKK